MKINLISQGQGIPVVFFHGWGFGHQVWLPLSAELGEQYQLLLVDLPGFGCTPMMNWIDFKTNLSEQLPSRFHVVGWSLGGLFAQRLAFEEPLRVSSFMCVASSPCFIAQEAWPALPKEAFTEFYKNLRQNPEKTLDDFVDLQLNKITFVKSRGQVPSLSALEEGLNILIHWDLRQELGDVSQPATFLFGRLDSIVPVRLMKTMQLLYPHFNCVFLKQAAHMPFLSHRDLFIKEFRRFIV